MSDDLDELTIDFDEVNEISLQPIKNQTELIYSKEKITLPVMTIYEKVNIISERVKQLNKGFKSTIEDIIEEEKLSKSYDIAYKEFQLGKIPLYYIKRILPNGTYELWSHDEFLVYPD